MFILGFGVTEIVKYLRFATIFSVLYNTRAGPVLFSSHKSYIYRRYCLGASLLETLFFKSPSPQNECELRVFLLKI